jgi:hypothetical protein
MPNHVTNIIEIQNLTINEKVNVFSKITNNLGEIDFNLILPCPKELNITSGTSTDFGVALINKQVPRYSQERTFSEWKTNLEKKYNKDDIIQFKKTGAIAVRNIEKYGVATWYEFCPDTWGTKWNAYGQEIIEVDSHYKKWMEHSNYKKRILKKKLKKINSFSFKFQTAWASPMPIINKISEMFPNAVFKISYADEDIGSNCGHYLI